MKNFKHKIYSIFVAILTLTFIFNFISCKTTKDEAKVKEDKTKIEDKYEPKNILDEAYKDIGTDRTQLSVPKYEERHYSMICKLPLIDQVMNHPFVLPSFLEDFSENLTKINKSYKDVYDLFLDRINSGVTYKPEKINITTSDKKALSEHIVKLFPELKLEDINSAFKSDPNNKDVYELIGKLASILDESFKLRKEAFKNLTNDELNKIKGDLLKYFFKDKKFRFLTVSTEQIKEQVEIVDILRKIDYAKLFQASELIALETENLIKTNKALSGETEFKASSPIFDLTTKKGRIIIGGSGSDKYDNPAEIIVDLGGDDNYGEGVGSSFNTSSSVIDLLSNEKDEHIGDTGISIIIDVNGNDTYESKEKPAQGNGILGVGFLYDASGDDTYTGKNFTQGSGYAGVGILVDRSGNDKYKGNFICQGSAYFGLGLIFDAEGNDEYRSDGLAQGFGSTMGAGLIYDANGEDYYACGVNKPVGSDLEWGMGQGMGLGNRSYPWLNDYAMYGGVGLMVDDKGNDKYEGHAFTQGSAYFMGVGGLIDREGDDYYKGLGSHHHGGGIHLCAGILIDLNGNDKYEAVDSSQGSGNDRTIGFQIDYNGNDEYFCKGNAQGYSRKGSGIALLCDYQGDDKYEMVLNDPDARGQAYAQVGAEPFWISNVVFLDLNGKDTYKMSVAKKEEAKKDDVKKDDTKKDDAKKGEAKDDKTAKIDKEIEEFESHRKNNSKWQGQPGVIGIDTELKEKQNLYDEYKPLKVKEGNDPFTQFHLVYKNIVPTPEAEFEKWVNEKYELMKTEKDVYYPMEQVTHLSFSNKLKQTHYLSLMKWLSSTNEHVRLFTIKLLGRNATPEFSNEILTALSKETDSYVRKFIIETLGKIGNVKAVSKVIYHINNDNSIECKRFAIMALYDILVRFPDDKQYLVFVNALSDKSPEIRYTAAKMLAKIGEKRALPDLLKLENDPDVYVKRAVSHALLAAGEKKGIPIMISTMDFYSLDNSYYNYGWDLGNILKQFTNNSFKKDESKPQDHGKNDDRLNKEKWQKWWDENKDTLNIAQYLAPAKLIDEGDQLRRDKKFDEARKKYEEAVAKHPGYIFGEYKIKDLEEYLKEN